jgi:hypothetical protein
MRSRCGIDAEKEFLSLLVDLVAANDLANLCALSSMRPKSCVTVRQSEVPEEEDDDEDYGTTHTTGNRRNKILTFQMILFQTKRQ